MVKLGKNARSVSIVGVGCTPFKDFETHPETQGIGEGDEVRLISPQNVNPSMCTVEPNTGDDECNAPYPSSPPRTARTPRSPKCRTPERAAAQSPSPSRSSGSRPR